MSRVGLVLGAGGLVGEAFHRGVVRALRERAGWDARDADVVVGTSAGALVAATVRAPRRVNGAARERDVPGLPVPEAAMAPLPALGALVAAARRPWRARPAVVAATLLPAGGRSLSFISEGLDGRFGGDWPAAETWITAVCRTDGRRVVFGRDGAPPATMGQAAAASCAVPGLFRPVRVGDHAYVDGGVHSPTNLDLLVGQGLDVVFVSSPMSVSPGGARPVLGLSLRLLWHRRLSGEAAAVRKGGTTVVAFEPSGSLLGAMGLHPLRAGRVDEVEELSYHAATERLAAGDVPPHTLAA